jgi:hypothetical protein
VPIAFCNEHQSSMDRIYPLKGINLNKGNWILCHTLIENISSTIDSTEIILDQSLLKENVDSFYILNSKEFQDCGSKTPGCRFTLYYNYKHFSQVTYCYPEQVSLGTMKGKFEKSQLLKEWIDKGNLKLKIDSIHKINSTILLYPQQSQKKKEVLVGYLEVI